MTKYILLVLLFLNPINALELDIGGGIFNSPTDGTIIYQTNVIKGSSADLNNDSQIHGYAWLDYKLGIPYTPHILFEYTRMRSTGRSHINLKADQLFIRQAFNDLGIQDSFSIGSSLLNTMYDATIYYDVLTENNFPNIAIGAGLKHFSYLYEISLSLNNQDLNDEGSANIPMLFIKMQKDLDIYPIGFEVELKGFATSDSYIIDITTKIDVLFDINKNTKAGFEFGYKGDFFNLVGNDVANIGGDITYSGLFFGFTLSFR